MAFALAIAATSTRAQAAFTQATCPSWLYPVNVPVKLGAHEFNTLHYDPSKYSHREHHFWNLMVNTNIGLVKFRAGPNFSAEVGYDYLQINNTQYNVMAQGSYTAGHYPDDFWDIGVTWHTDSSVSNGPAPFFDNARLTCLSTVQPTVPRAPMLENTRRDGILLSSGDVVYTSVMQPALSYMVLVLNAETAAVTPGADFDLYASTATSMPDDSNFTWRGYTGSRYEALDLGWSSSSRNVYIGVRSYTGAGQFTLHAYAQKSVTRVARKLCTNGWLKEAVMPAISPLLRVGSNWLLQATQGNEFVSLYQIAQQSCDSTCNICMRGYSDCGWSVDWPQGFGPGKPNTMWIPHFQCSDYADPIFKGMWLAHELGHQLLYVGDEYWWPSTPWCGHSIMNGPNGNSRTFCTASAHATDATGSLPNPIPPSGWSTISSYFFPNGQPSSNTSADPSVEAVNNPHLGALITVN